MFDAETPAGVFVGCFQPWQSAASLEAYKASVACRLDPTETIPTRAALAKLTGCRPEVDLGLRERGEAVGSQDGRLPGRQALEEPLEASVGSED